MSTNDSNLAGAIYAEMILESRVLIQRYFKGFGDANRTEQAPNLPNHAAWTLGHLALTMHRCAQKFDGVEPPASDFATGDGTAGGAERYDTESVSFASKPVNDAARYPAWARCLAIFDSAIERLAGALRSADPAKLDSPTRWGQGEVPLRTMAPRMCFHNGNHCGQLADLRRALGMGSIFA